MGLCVVNDALQQSCEQWGAFRGLKTCIGGVRGGSNVWGERELCRGAEHEEKHNVFCSASDVPKNELCPTTLGLVSQGTDPEVVLGLCAPSMVAVVGTSPCCPQ